MDAYFTLRPSLPCSWAAELRRAKLGQLTTNMWGFEISQGWGDGTGQEGSRAEPQWGQQRPPGLWGEEKTELGLV